MKGKEIETIKLFSSLTPRHLILFIICWMIIFATGSVFISIPFGSENVSEASKYARVMYMHGLLISAAALTTLTACLIFSIRSFRVLAWISGSAVAAAILSMLGGIGDNFVPAPPLVLWPHIIGLFALDTILIVLFLGMLRQWRETRSLPFLLGMMSVSAMEVSALTGHLAGWIKQYSWKFPAIIAAYAQSVGFDTQKDFTDALVGSHSHEMAVGSMALVAALIAQQFGYSAITGLARRISKIGLSMLSLGIVTMTIIYSVMALTPWSPPTVFVSGPKGVNGIPADDLITGFLVMFGGIVLIAGLMIGRRRLSIMSFLWPIRLAVVWSWILSFITIVVAGYAIQLNEAYFGAGNVAEPGAAKDAIFTWFHQDIGLFVLPAIAIIMVIADCLHLTDEKYSVWVGVLTLAGSTLVFAGGIIWIFINPSLFGPGYIVATAGLLLCGGAILAMLWCAIFGNMPDRGYRLRKEKSL